MAEDVHPRNRLNDLSNRDWLTETKSLRLAAPGGDSGEAGEVLGEYRMGAHYWEQGE